MNIGITIACMGLALGLGAGGAYLWEHPINTPKQEERALPKGSQVFGTPPHIQAPVPNLPLTQEALVTKARELAPTPEPSPKIEAPKEEPQVVEAPVHVKVVHRHKAVRHHRKTRHVHRTRSAVELKSTWAEQQPAPFSLGRLFNVQ